MGKKPYYGKYKRSRNEDGEARDNRENFEERHKGSISIEEVKSSEEYHRKITIDGTKRKFAICFGYLGTNYQGLQINPDAITVEAVLEKALFLAGGIEEFNFGNLQKIQWTRAARTDRGVHAVSQCCAMKLIVPSDREQFISSINSFLPNDIRVHTLTRVTKNFNSKLFCGKRRYNYLIPTYILTDIHVVNELLEDKFKLQGPKRGAGHSGGYADPNSQKFLEMEILRDVRTTLLSLEHTPGSSSPTPSRVGASRVCLLREALRCFEGTQNFHNFTTGKLPSEANATRFIQSFECSEPFIASLPSTPDNPICSSSPPAVHSTSSESSICTEGEREGVEYVLLSVTGQSFLLNQIRRMVSFAVEVARGATSLEHLRAALTKKKVDIPMVPGLGLYLDELYFDGYNMKQAADEARAVNGAQKKKQKEQGKRSSSEPSSKKPEPQTLKQSVNKEEGAGEVEGEGDEASKRLKLESGSIDPPVEFLGREGGTGGSEQPSDLALSLGEKQEEGSEGGGGAGGGRVEKEEEEEGDAGEGEGVGVGSHERLEWHSSPSVVSRMAHFRESLLWPHVFQEERSGLAFLHYLDYLRVCQHKYEAREMDRYAPSTPSPSSSTATPQGERGGKAMKEEFEE